MQFVDYESLTYDDVLLEPQYTTVRARDVDVSAQLTKELRIKAPIVSAPMDTVTESKLAIALANVGGIGIIHRNLSIEQESEEVAKVKAEMGDDQGSVDAQGHLMVGAGVGPGSDLEARVSALVEAGADVICVDSAQGHSQYVIDAVATVRRLFPKIPLIGGNIATADGAKRLIDAGASGLRVGLGPGAICTTRIISGMGVPQLTAISETVKVAAGYNIPVIADGGIKYSGDITKALAAGASCVMLGSLMARTLEAPGDLIKKDGKQFKQYRGMGSIAAMQAGSAARYGQEGVSKARMVAEGVEGLVPYKGTVEDYVYQLVGGLRAGMGYIGAGTIAEMPQKARFIRISPAALAESHPHSMVVTNAGKNYGQ